MHAGFLHRVDPNINHLNRTAEAQTDVLVFVVKGQFDDFRQTGIENQAISEIELMPLRKYYDNTPKNRYIYSSMTAS